VVEMQGDEMTRYDLALEKTFFTEELLSTFLSFNLSFFQPFLSLESFGI
jgi:hypothetical protein